MDIIFHREFQKALLKQPQKIHKKFAQAIDTFRKDQFHYSLNNHALRGKYQGRRSINITGDVRAIYRIDKKMIIFMEIGTHSQLYK